MGKLFLLRISMGWKYGESLETLCLVAIMINEL